MSTFQPSRVRDARLRAGLTQAQLARRAETTEKNILRWEKGHNEPRAQHVAALAVATGVEPNYFFADDARREEQESSEDDEEADQALLRVLRQEIRRIVRQEVAA